MVLAVSGVLGVAVAALSGRIRRLPASVPMLAMATGLVLGPAVTGVLPVPSLIEDPSPYHEAGRILLSVSVMAVGLRYPLRQVRRHSGTVLVLLVLGMPVMAAATAGVAGVTLGVGLATALLVGAALCPTDPVLASGVVTGEPAERDIAERSRQVLSLESGANDGLALPLVLVAVSIAGPVSLGAAVLESLWQVVSAVLLGSLIGWAAGRALRAGEHHGATEGAPVLFLTLLLALGVLGLGGLLHADGILAVFVAGLAFNAAGTGGERSGAAKVDEGVNRFVVIPLFLAFGAALPVAAWADLGWRGALLVPGVLLLRRIPLLVLLRRPLRLAWADCLYLGWFGPVGVSALFYLTLEADRLRVDPAVLAAGSLVMAASVLAHGLTGTPGRRLYARAAHRRGLSVAGHHADHSR
ncbi:cation:proton antiporter [Actinoplanes sp. NPDC048967]|uniref:cation:proton antiporter domain-containing protein n=1 Tax=Actinoplanes sp. NPDC048967 TaxID=3155269 RepID=UPI0033C5D766